MLPIVSVIIPLYNSEKFIAETIESVSRQTFRNFEVLLVDDGSTDGSKEIVQRCISGDSRFKYIYQSNKGVSAARNNGFNHSNGMFVAFLDSDDVWEPDNLELKLERFDDDNIGLVHSDAVIINEHSARTEAVLSGCEGDILDALLSWQGTQISGPSSILVRRKVLEIVGLFDENLSTAADKDLFVRIAAQFKVARIKKITWRYRLHGANMHKNIRAMEADVLRLYAKAHEMHLFRDAFFERKCLATTYLILAACWAGDGRNAGRASVFLIRAVVRHPPIIFDFVRKALKRWRF